MDGEITQIHSSKNTPLLSSNEIQNFQLLLFVISFQFETVTLA